MEAVIDGFTLKGKSLLGHHSSPLPETSENYPDARSSANDSVSKLSPLAKMKQMAQKTIFLLKAEKQNASNKQINEVTISHSQSITIIYSLFFRGENSHASWMPFPFSVSIH